MSNVEEKSMVGVQMFWHVAFSIDIGKNILQIIFNELVHSKIERMAYKI